jgi:acyl-CoA thioesterase
MRDANWFDTDTAVTLVRSGEFSGILSDRWNRLGGGPLGSYTLAVAISALTQTLPHPDPLAVSAHFLRPGSLGPATITTELLKSGKTTSTGSAVLAQNDKPVIAVTATYTDLRARMGTTTSFDAPPNLPPPKRCIDPWAGVPIGDVTIRERVECRYPEPFGWLGGQPTLNATAEFWIRLTDNQPTSLHALALLVDAAAPVILELGETGSMTVELTVHLRRHPAPGWLACRASTKHISDGLHEEDFEIWDSTGQLVAQSRQLALLPARR